MTIFIKYVENEEDENEEGGVVNSCFVDRPYWIISHYVGKDKDRTFLASKVKNDIVEYLINNFSDDGKFLDLDIDEYGEIE